MTAAPVAVEPWQLTYDDMPDEEFPDGLRISTDCLPRRLIEPLDPTRYHEFPAHLGHRGHGLERVLQEWLEKKHGITSYREIVVPWSHGETHLDLFLPEPGDLFGTEGRPVMIELKANKDAQVRSENVRQVHRQQWAAEQANGEGVRYPMKDESGEWVYAPFPFDLTEATWILLVIDPTTWKIPDPRGVRVELTDERRVELAEEWAIMDEFQARSFANRKYAIEFAEGMPKCVCGKCFRPEPRELEHDLVDHAMQYHTLGEDAKELKDERSHHQAILKERMLQRFAHLEKDAQLEQAAGPYVGGGWRVTLTKTGSVRVSPAKEGEAATPIL